VGMVRSGSPSLHAILKESTSEDDSALSDGGNSGFPIPQDCNVVTSVIPIMTTPPPEATPAFQTTPTVPRWTVVPQPSTKLLPEWLRANQEEQQCILQADIKRRATQR
jgi:hypothetical protein